MEQEAIYSYSIDGNGTMTIYENEKSLCEISDCNEENCEEIFEEVVWEMRGVELRDVV